MAQYEIKPFEITPEFEDCWNSAGHHLSLRVRDTGASWLRAELPVFREHLSFALGNQLFFIQMLNADDPSNGWWQPRRLASIVSDANGIACLMPMSKRDGSWKPTESGWGLIDPETRLPIVPTERVTDERIIMSDWEIHDVGVQVARQYLASHGWTIASWQSDLGVDPSMFAHKDGYFCGFVVRNSNKGPDIGVRPHNANTLAQEMHARGWGAKFIGLKVAADDDFFDPRLQHLTRRIYRRSRLLFSNVQIEELSQNIQ